MNSALGFSFGRERVYLVQISRENDAVRLHAALSIEPSPITEGETGPSGRSYVARIAEAFREALFSLPLKSSSAGGALPMSWTFSHVFPESPDVAPAALQARSKWEIGTHFPGESIDDRASVVYPLHGEKGKFLSIAYSKGILEKLSDMFAALNVNLVSSAAAVPATTRMLQWCYPDVGETPCAVIECGGSDATVTMVRGDRLAGMRQFEMFTDAADVIHGLEHVEQSLGIHAQEILVWGESLHRNALSDITAGKSLRTVRRMNAFRGVDPNGISERTKEYCKRTAHLFPAAMGAALAALDRGETEGMQR